MNESKDPPHIIRTHAIECSHCTGGIFFQQVHDEFTGGKMTFRGSGGDRFSRMDPGGSKDHAIPAVLCVKVFNDARTCARVLIQSHLYIFIGHTVEWRRQDS